MTTPAEILHAVGAMGGRIEPAGDKLRALLPADCPPSLKDEIRQHKAELLAELAKRPGQGWQSVPPNDLPMVSTMPHPDVFHREMVVAYLLRQTGGQPGSLSAWLVRREDFYFDGPGAKWDCGLICYAAARDAACWQLKRSERDLCVFLEAADEAASGGHGSPKDRRPANPTLCQSQSPEQRGPGQAPECGNQACSTIRPGGLPTTQDRGSALTRPHPSAPDHTNPQTKMPSNCLPGTNGFQAEQLSLISETPVRHTDSKSFADELRDFTEFQKQTQIEQFPDPGVKLPVYTNEFWTSKQRAASSLHEISYRACFKPQLPRFFISRLTSADDVVYDPFMGRGTTPLEAALLGRRPAGCDINPLSTRLLAPRLNPPSEAEVADRLAAIPQVSSGASEFEELTAFYHPKTLEDICSLRRYLLDREGSGEVDAVDSWIRMVATNRLTGHSPGFFSVYTLPPNQAVTVEAQKKINEKLNQTPPERDTNEIILAKTRSLLKNICPSELRNLQRHSKESLLITGSCDQTPQIGDASVSLVVTSPPFLDVVDYQKDNWLRCWFNGIDPESIPIWQFKKVEDWKGAMTRVFQELRRILKPSGYVAFEVGEVRGGKLLMETLVVPAAQEAGLVPELILINDQVFTKTANCWGVSNLEKGTNTNRIILLQKED